jgi:hypothetical protein
MLSERRQSGAGGEPHPPLILGAWHYASDVEKSDRLLEQIEWADQHAKLSEVEAFLRNLQEKDWHHTGD